MGEKVILQLLVTTRDIPICIYIHVNYLPVHTIVTFIGCVRKRENKHHRASV